MSLEFELPLVSFIFLLILNIIYFSKKRVDLPENKLYKVILICSLLEALIDTVIHLICSVNTFDVHAKGRPSVILREGAASCQRQLEDMLYIPDNTGEAQA